MGNPLLLTAPDGRAWTAPSLASADRERVRWGGFPAFARLALGLVPMMRDPAWEWHLTEMCVHAQALFEGRTDTLNVNVPPGCSKSALYSVLFPAWIWTEDPSYQIMSASFDPSLSRKHAGWTIDIMQSRWFVERWGDLLLAATNKGEFFLRAGGYRYATSIRGKGTGRHCDMYTIDDPLKPADVQDLSGAKLSAELDRAITWYGTSVFSRASSARQAILTVMQRLHEGDPCGFLAETLGPMGRMSELVLPYWFEGHRRCVTPFGGDRRRTDGAILTERIRQKVERTVAAYGGREGAIVQSQYQQNPTPAGGTIFKPETFGLFEAAC